MVTILGVDVSKKDAAFAGLAQISKISRITINKILKNIRL